MKLAKYVVPLFALFANNAYAQTNINGAVAQANKEYKSLKYANAIGILEKVANKAQDNVQAQEILANSYRLTKAYVKAENWYAKLTGNANVKPAWALCYAEVLANNQHYAQSEQWYQKYLAMVGADKRAQGMANAYTNVQNFAKNKKRWTVDYTNINTAAAEYSPTFFKSGLVFVSNRREGNLSKHIYGWDQTPFSDLYFIDSLSSIKSISPDSLLANTPQKNIKTSYRVNDDDTRATANDSRAFSDRLLQTKDTLGYLAGAGKLAKLLAGGVNSKYHEGPIAVLPDESIVFTRNNYYQGKAKSSRDGINKLKLFEAKAPLLDQVTPFPYNSDEYSVGHPALNKAGTMMVFASDMPGGQGGVDLYYTVRNSLKDAWQKPVNLGPNINTEGDESFPALWGDSTLLFASTGLPGLGGYDIFTVEMKNNNPGSTPINLGAPINSSADDFAMIRSENSFTGFFSSNRRGNDDIYRFSYKDFQIVLKGKVEDAKTMQPLANTKLNVINDQARTPIFTNENGEFETHLLHQANLQLILDKPGYALFLQDISTQNIDDDTTITVNIKLNQLPLIAKKTQSDDCDRKRAGLDEFKVYYDFDKSKVRDDAFPTVDSLVAFLNAHPQVSLVAASYCDSRGSKDYNIGLSLRRSKSAKKILMEKGIDANRIKVFYYGEDRPINNCKDGVDCDEHEMQLNRRTDFMLFFNGKNLLDMDCAAWPGK